MAKYDIIGTFVFRNDGDGCLSGKYVNEDSANGPLGESAKFVKDIERSIKCEKKDFEGEYNVVWLEDEGHRSGILSIEYYSDKNIYDLTWKNNDTSNYNYKGIGMLYDGLLVGSYWSE